MMVHDIDNAVDEFQLSLIISCFADLIGVSTIMLIILYPKRLGLGTTFQPDMKPFSFSPSNLLFTVR